VIIISGYAGSKRPSRLSRSCMRLIGHDEFRSMKTKNREDYF
jgi:hypothetical protein